MPASRSRNPSTERQRRPFGLVIVLASLVAAALILAALPASIAARFLPKNIRASELSGSVWHGSAGRLTLDDHEAGALEWRIHPLQLLRGRIGAEVHWVKGAFVLDATLELGRSSFTAESVRGGGPLQDLGEFNQAPGWQADVAVAIDRIAVIEHRVQAARGTIKFQGLSSPQTGGDAGSYLASFGDDALKGDGGAIAHVEDQGGPLEVHATVDIEPAQRLATLSGSVKERDNASEALRRDLESLAQIRGRDREGRIALDFEFAL